MLIIDPGHGIPPFEVSPNLWVQPTRHGSDPIFIYVVPGAVQQSHWADPRGQLAKTVNNVSFAGVHKETFDNVDMNLSKFDTFAYKVQDVQSPVPGYRTLSTWMSPVNVAFWLDKGVHRITAIELTLPTDRQGRNLVSETFQNHYRSPSSAIAV